MSRYSPVPEGPGIQMADEKKKEKKKKKKKKKKHLMRSQKLSAVLAKIHRFNFAGDAAASPPHLPPPSLHCIIHCWTSVGIAFVTALDLCFIIQLLYN